MDTGKLCRAVREEWMEAFDEDRTPSAGVLGHIAGCGGCREFAAACERAQIGIRSAPPCGTDPAADAALLAALRAAPERKTGLVAALRRFLRPPGRHGALQLAGAGAASFAVTLLVAGILSGVSEPGHAGGVAQVQAPAEAPSGRQAAATDVELEAWLNAGRLTPLQLVLRSRREIPDPPEPDPARRSRRFVPRRIA